MTSIEEYQSAHQDTDNTFRRLQAIVSTETEPVLTLLRQEMEKIHERIMGEEKPSTMTMESGIEVMHRIEDRMMEICGEGLPSPKRSILGPLTASIPLDHHHSSFP